MHLLETFGLLLFLTIHYTSSLGIAPTAAQTAEDKFKCRGIRNKRNAQISYPPNITGSWFSASCEQLPGPQYVLRHYEFSSNGIFSITRYYYSDQVCSVPSYSIHSEGSIHASSLSWVLSEGTDMDFTHEHMSIRPYSTEAAHVLSRMLNNNCRLPSLWENGLPYESVSINTKDELCLETLVFSINELLVMRQVNYGKADSTHSLERELQLGNVWFSQWQRPSSYQQPLYDVSHKHCAACQCIYEASVESPPKSCHDNKKKPELGAIQGSWYSHRCESVTNGLFTLRVYIFNQTNSSYLITTHYFTDAFCSAPSFTLEAAGSYLPLDEHRSLWNTRAYKLSTKSIKAILLSANMVATVNLGDTSKCGHVAEWNLGKQYDLSNTGGCDALGLEVRDEEFVLVKTEKHSHAEYLQMSEPKANEEDFYSQITFFEQILKRCSQTPDRWLQYETTTPLNASYRLRQNTFLMILVVVLSCFY